jgi:hypothetical protein
MKLPINLPDRVVKDQAVTAAWANSIREAIWRLSKRKPPIQSATPAFSTPNPFEVSLFRSGEIWKVTIEDGYVNERIPGGTGDALKTHFPNNIKSGDARAKFTVIDGKQVSLIVEVDEEGEITAAGSDPAVRVAIEDIDEESTHFEPKIGDASTGVAGVYHYKLATIEEGDTVGVLELKNYLAGSHVSHFRELPLLKNLPDAAAANTGRIIKAYDKATNQYRFRSIAKGDGQLRVDESGDNVRVRGNGKAFTLRYQVSGSSATDVADFVDGLIDDTGTVTIPIPVVPTDGWWGTLKWQHFTNIGDTTPYEFLQAVVENGRIISVARQGPGESSPTTISGTQGTPGSGVFTSFATP